MADEAPSLSVELKPTLTLRVVQGDLTQAKVDAIVNAANAHLQHGGGVAGAIARRGGPQIQRESDAWLRRHGPIAHNQAAVTGGGRLPCRYVIHVVGPVWGSGDEDHKLAQAVTAALHASDERKLKTLAFPAISTGIFGFPIERAAKVILEAIIHYAEEHPQSTLQRIDLILFDRPAFTVFAEALRSRLPDRIGGP